MFMGKDKPHVNKDQIITGVVRRRKNIIQGNRMESMGVGGEELPARAKVWGQEQACGFRDQRLKAGQAEVQRTAKP